MTKQLNLPEPVAAYFEADRLDGEAVARCFTRDAVVKDEGHTYTGVDAIRTWRTEASKKYTYTSEPIACAQEDDMTVVTSHTVGNFPGSAVDLRYFFRLERGKIAALTVVP
jgi:SnoaL-like domain